MKRLWTVSLILLAVTMTLASELPWSNSLDASLAKAKQQHRPVLLFMKMEWSAICTQMRREVFSNVSVVKDAKAFIPVMLDGDHEGRTVARQYEVKGYPEVLFLDSNGLVIWRTSGLREVDGFKDDMSKALLSLKQFPGYVTRIQKDKNDAEALAALARIYANRNDIAKAQAMLQRAEAADPKNEKGYLGAAWNAVGDCLQMGLKFDEARTYFQSVVTFSKIPSEVAYAQSSIAACFIGLNQYDEAIKVLEAMLASTTTPPKDKSQAQKNLDRLKGRNPEGVR